MHAICARTLRGALMEGFKTLRIGGSWLQLCCWATAPPAKGPRGPGNEIEDSSLFSCDGNGFKGGLHWNFTRTLRPSHFPLLPTAIFTCSAKWSDGNRVASCGDGASPARRAAVTRIL
jgi:hypothetical protein